jgi:hypothetical protein
MNMTGYIYVSEQQQELDSDEPGWTQMKMTNTRGLKWTLMNSYGLFGWTLKNSHGWTGTMDSMDSKGLGPWTRWTRRMDSMDTE